jgi:hypothetical protein
MLSLSAGVSTGHVLYNLEINVPSDAQTMLKAGIELLSEMMLSRGFLYTPTSAGRGSGGVFAAGEFRRGNRKLELHYRYSLGLVSYHVGSLMLSHEDFMWAVIGTRWRSHYPGFPKEPLDGFRNLLDDLKEYCGDFLTGSDAVFAFRVEEAETLKKTASRLP